VDNFACVAGMVKLVLVDTRPDSPTEGRDQRVLPRHQNPTLVQVPNLVYHGWKCISLEPSLVVNVPTEPYRYDEPDEYRSRRTARCPTTGRRKDG
jgi:dTDP-4-dehydrorhamnose 3,5-epimerase